MWQWVCSPANLSVEKMHVASLESMSIIERKTKGRFTWILCCTNCISPDRAGLGEANRETIICLRSRSSVGSCAFISTSFWYVIDSVPRPFPRGTKLELLATMDTSGFIFDPRMQIMLLKTGVIAAIIHMPWKVFLTSRVQMLWSTLSAAHWTIQRKSQKCHFCLTPQHCAQICTPPCRSRRI